MKRVAIAILLLWIPLTVTGQDSQLTPETGGIITGQVYDRETRTPLNLVDVYLDSILIGGITGRDGRFVIRYIPEGTYTLIVQRLGYRPYRENNVRIVRGKLISRRIALEPTEIAGQEVLITATRKEQTAQMAPASVVILRASELESRPIHTFDQALEAIPGVSIFRAAGTSVQSLSIRGSSDVAGGGVGNRVLLLVDGRPALTSDAGGAYWSLVPTNFIERVEVVKGAFSSLYGSTAMGGVINVITRRPSYQSLTHIAMKYGFYEKAPEDIRYTDKLLLQRQIEVSYSGANGRLSYLFNASNKKSDGHAENTAYNFYDIFTKIMYDLQYNRNLEVTLGGGIAKNDFPHSWLNSAQPLRVRTKYTDDRQEKRQFNFDVHYWAVPNTRVKYSSRFYYYNNAARSFFNENDPFGTLPGNEPLGSKTIIDGHKYGNITQRVHTELGVNYMHQFAYDAGDRPVQLVTSSGRTINYVRDAERRISEVSTDVDGLLKTLVSNIQYQPDGQETFASFANGMAESRSFDENGLLLNKSLAPDPAGVVGDVAPVASPDGVVNAADYLVMMGIVLGISSPTPVQLQNGDLYPVGSPDGVINIQDLILLVQMVMQ